MKKLRLFGLLVTVVLLAFSMAVGCSNGSTTDDSTPKDNARKTVFEDKTKGVELTISNRDDISARTRDAVWSGDNYVFKLNGNAISSGTVSYTGLNNMYLKFTPTDGGTSIIGYLAGGVLTIDELVYSGGTLKNLVLNEAGGSGVTGPAAPTGPTQPTAAPVLSKTIAYTVNQAGGAVNTLPSRFLELMFDRSVALTSGSVTLINDSGEAYLDRNVDPQGSANGVYWLLTLDDVRSKQGFVNVKINLPDVYSGVIPVAIYSKLDTPQFQLSSGFNSFGGPFALSSGQNSSIPGQYFQTDTKYLVIEQDETGTPGVHYNTLLPSDAQYIKITPLTSSYDDDLKAQFRPVRYSGSSGSGTANATYNFEFTVLDGAAGQGPVMIQFTRPGYAPYAVVADATSSEKLNYTLSADGSANSVTTQNITATFDYNPDLLLLNGGSGLTGSSLGDPVYPWAGGGSSTVGLGVLDLTSAGAITLIKPDIQANPAASVKERVFRLPNTGSAQIIERLNTREGTVNVSITSAGVVGEDKPVVVHRAALAKIASLTEVKTGGVSTAFLFTLDRLPDAGAPPLSSGHCVVDAGPSSSLPGTLGSGTPDLVSVRTTSASGPATTSYVYSFTGATPPTKTTAVGNAGLARFQISHPDVEDFRIVSLTDDLVGFTAVSATGGSSGTAVITVRFPSEMYWYDTTPATQVNSNRVAQPTALTLQANGADFAVTVVAAAVGTTNFGSATLTTVAAPTFATNNRDTTVRVDITGFSSSVPINNKLGLYFASGGQIDSFVDKTSIASGSPVVVTVGN